MSVSVPADLDALYEALDSDPHAHVLAGGTDFMVEVNFGHRDPGSVIALRNVDALRGWRREGDQLIVGAACTYREMEEPSFAALAPALSSAARTVGSPQIRNAGTIGGNVATASPAGDTLPVLYAYEATLTLGSSSGVRELAISDFVMGPKRTVRAPNEVVLDVRIPVLNGPQEYLKIGTRNAMVIAVADVALVVDTAGRTVRCAMGSVGPTILRAVHAEAFIAPLIDWTSGGLLDRSSTTDEVVAQFGAMAGAAAQPIDDHRSTAAYRRKGIEVLAARALGRSLARMGGS